MTLMKEMHAMEQEKDSEQEQSAKTSQSEVTRRGFLTGPIVAMGAVTAVAALRPTVAKAAAVPPPDPLVSHHFELTVGGQPGGFFTECTGIGSESDIVEVKLVDANGVAYIQKVPGRLRWNEIGLARGITANTYIWTWRKLVEDGQIGTARQDCTITMYDQSGAPMAQWQLTGAWPVSITGPGVAVEAVVLTVDRVSRVA